jgi:hypothetical protein
MMKNRLSMVAAVLFAPVLLVCVAAAPDAAAQTPTASQAPTASGHWTGVLETPTQPLDVEVDLKPGTPPAWLGTISIPAQNLKAFPLSQIEVQGTSVSFVMANVPGTPTFKGTLAVDGQTITGDFAQGGGSLPLKLNRKGDAVFTAPAKSTAVAKELEGTWNGSLAVGDRTLRLTLKLANGPDGATGSMVSVDQGGAEVPITTITQAGSQLTLELPSIAGSYSGDLKDGKLIGTWRQGPGSLPLEFTRAAP